MTDTSAPFTADEIVLNRKAIASGAFSKNGHRAHVRRSADIEADLITVASMTRDQIRAVLINFQKSIVEDSQKILANERARSAALQATVSTVSAIVVTQKS